MKILTVFQKTFMRLFFLTLTIYFFSSCSNQSNNIEGIIDGTYDLVEQTQNNSTYNAPDVSGRVIFFDGKFSVSFHKRFDPEKYFTYAGFGDYKFENNKFAYRYTNSMALNGDESHQYIGDPNKSYGDGEYRWYEYELKADGLFMVSEDEKQEWNFLNTGDMIYIDLIDLSGLPITRTWKKVP